MKNFVNILSYIGLFIAVALCIYALGFKKLLLISAIIVLVTIVCALISVAVCNFFEKIRKE